MYLDFLVAKNLLEKYNISIVKSEIAQTEQHAKDAADKVGFPCVVKLNSAVHKTDSGLVIKNLENHHQVEEAFSEIKKKSEKLEFDGVVVQKMLHGKEIIIGAKQDAQFGPVVLFGLGGIFVEVMKDVSLKIAPVTKEEAKRMVESIKGYPVLTGVRGEKQVAIEKIIDAIVSVSKLISEHPEIKELDLNPLIVSDKYCEAVDLRVIC